MISLGCRFGWVGGVGFLIFFRRFWWRLSFIKVLGEEKWFCLFCFKEYEGLGVEFREIEVYRVSSCFRLGLVF